MVKQKNKNKFILFMCSIMLCFCSVFTLFNNSIGTTYAISPTEPIITEESYNYKSSTFADHIDIWLTDVYNIWAFAGFKSAYICETDLQTSFQFDLTYQPTMYYYDPVDGFLSMLLAVPTSSDLRIGYANNLYPNNFRGKSFYFPAPADTSSAARLEYNNARRFFVVAKGTDGNYYTACSPELTASYRAYQEGLQAGGGSTGPTYEEGYNAGYEKGYNVGFTDGTDEVINNPNDYDLYTEEQYSLYYNTGYNIGYGLGFANGEIQGKVIGANTVINNPNNYDLYTLSQIENSYNDGYNFGSTEGYNQGYDIGYIDGTKAVNGVFSNAVFRGTLAIIPETATDIDDALIIYTITNDSFNFTNGIITPTTELINAYNEFIDIYYNQIFSSRGDYLISSTLIIDNLNFVYTEDMQFNFFNLNTINVLKPYYFYADIQLKDVDDSYFNIVYQPIVEDGSTDILTVNVIDYTDYSYLVGNFVESISINLVSPPPVYDDNYFSLTPVSLDYFMLYEKNALYDYAYQLGYENAITGVNAKKLYDEGYNEGRLVGYNEGHLSGLQNADKATFPSMISAVIDVPINALRNLFNFEILGINLFGFFTGLFTLLIIITIIKLFLGR